MVIFNKEELISHITDENDRQEIRRVIDKIDIVLTNYVKVSTDFLNPHEVYLAKSVLNRFTDEISYEIDGGYDGAENCIIYIYPSYETDILKEDIDIFRFSSISTIKHGDVLGSLIGLGIERKKIGDILVGTKYTYFFVKNEISNFIEFSLKKVSRYNIDLNRVKDVSDIPKREYIYKDIIVASLRLDNVVSSCVNISRTQSKNVIKSREVKVNYHVEDRPHLELSEEDLISVRGFGRFQIDKVLRKTKKGNIVLKIKINK